MSERNDLHGYILRDNNFWNELDALVMSEAVPDYDPTTIVPADTRPAEGTAADSEPPERIPDEPVIMEKKPEVQPPPIQDDPDLYEPPIRHQLPRQYEYMPLSPAPKNRRSGATTAAFITVIVLIVGLTWAAIIHKSSKNSSDVSVSASEEKGTGKSASTTATTEDASGTTEAETETNTDSTDVTTDESTDVTTAETETSTTVTETETETTTEVTTTVWDWWNNQQTETQYYTTTTEYDYETTTTQTETMTQEYVTDTEPVEEDTTGGQSEGDTGSDDPNGETGGDEQPEIRDNNDPELDGGESSGSDSPG